MDKTKLKRWAKFSGKLAITSFALYFVFTKIDIQALGSLIKDINLPLIFLALLFFAFSKFIAALRFNKFLSCTAIKISDRTNIKLYLLGMYYNMFLPGGIGGDGYKIYWLKQRFDVKTGKIFQAVLLDRVTGVLALFCLTVVFAYSIPIPVLYKYFLWLLIPFSILIFYFLNSKFFSAYLPIFISANIQSFFVQGAQVVSALLILYAMGVYTMSMQYMFVFLISSIIAIIPFTIGGVGAREITFLMGAGWIGLDVNASIALSLLFYIITALVSFAGIYFSIRSQKIQTDD